MTLNNAREELTVRLERAVLVSVALPDPALDRRRSPRRIARPGRPRPAPSSSASFSSSRDHIIPGTYIGKGKLEELHDQVQATDADVVIFDNDLSPAQVRNLEKATKVKVLDRSELILDIFATRARTVEARLQVELAQLEYALPRLRKMWTHLVALQGRHRHCAAPAKPSSKKTAGSSTVRIRDLKGRLSDGAGPQAARGAQPLRGAHRFAGRLHQRRQEHADESP